MRMKEKEKNHLRCPQLSIVMVAALSFSSGCNAFFLRPYPRCSPLLQQPPIGTSTKIGSSGNSIRLKGLHQWKPRLQADASLYKGTTTSSALQAIISPFLSMAALGTVIAVHECGHYLAARFFGIRVREFSIGIGPKIWGFSAWGDEFSLRVLPLGGYVMFAGAEEEQKTKKGTGAALIKTDRHGEKGKRLEDSSKCLKNRPWHERVVVTSAGVALNLLFSYFLYLGIMIKRGILQKYSLPVVAEGAAFYIADITKDMFAEQCGFLLISLRSFIPFVSSSVISAVTDLDIGGPVRIIQEGSARKSMESLLVFVAEVSLSVGVTNALPIPGFDGGNLVFLLYEAIMGRKVNPRLEQIVTSVSFIFLFLILARTTLKDILFLFLG